MTLSLIAALARNGAIGKDNALLRVDQQYRGIGRGRAGDHVTQVLRSDEGAVVGADEAG